MAKRRYVDVSAILQVIGNIYNNNDLLDDESYTFHEEDFVEDFHKVLFGSIYNLHVLGSVHISLSAIEDYLQNRPKQYGIYKANNGSEYLKKVSAMVQLSTFDYYYQRMKKMTLLRMYDSIGVDVSWIYDTDNILDVAKKSKQEDWLDNTPIDEIADTIDKRVSDIRLKYVDNSDDTTVNAGDGAVDLLAHLAETPEVGYPLYGPLINTVTRGARLKKLYLRSASTGVGKALPNYTIIPTPRGRKRVGDVRVGDYLWGADGLPTKVLRIYPQPTKKRVYKLIFEDGREASCCNEHLWQIFLDGQAEMVSPTSQIIDYLESGRACYVPLNKSVLTKEEEDDAIILLKTVFMGKNKRVFSPVDPLFPKVYETLRALGIFVKCFYQTGRPVLEIGDAAIDKVQIIDYEETDVYTDMTCFTVDNKDSLFLTNDYIVTHNTRSMIADACHFACDTLYDSNKQEWVANGTKEPTLFISTEQELEELQTMMLAFVADVEEEHILNNAYYQGERERVVKAAHILEGSPLYIQELPDFSIEDIENVIKRNVRERKVKYVCMDYIHSSMKILAEATGKTGIKGLREDNVLFMISIKLKDLCNKYGIFILTSTQLNADYKTSETPDQNLLRGAKAIADKIDFGAILLEVTDDDREALKDLVSTSGFEMPTIKMSVYKNRRGRWKNIYLWCRARRGVCKIEPIFVTKWNYEIIPMEDVKIKVKSAF